MTIAVHKSSMGREEGGGEGVKWGTALRTAVFRVEPALTSANELQQQQHQRQREYFVIIERG